MRASRLLGILIALQVHGRASARELAARFEVSRRTIFRDMDELSAAGVPVYAERGSTGGYALLDGWRTQLTGITETEAESLLLGGVPQAVADLGLGTVGDAARLKLLAALSPQASRRARRVAEGFHLDPTPWGGRAGPPDARLQLVAQAVWNRQRLSLRDAPPCASGPLTVEPLGLVLKAGDWWFVCADKLGPRIHRLGRVRDLRVLPETFEPPRGFELSAAWRHAVERLEAGSRHARARVRFGPAAAARLGRMGDDDLAGALQAAAPDARGWREAEIAIEGLEAAAARLLGLGGEVEVLAPAALREEMARQAQAIAERRRDRPALPTTAIHRSPLADS